MHRRMYHLAILLLLPLVFVHIASAGKGGFNGVSIDGHQKRIHAISDQLATKPAGSRVTIRRSQSEGHCPRPLSYKHGAIQVDISDLKKVIGVDKVDARGSLPHGFSKKEIVAVADVQAMMSMEELVDILLPQGFIPAVVPEFKGITIGGSIQGLAAESTSFKFGFVHDAIAGFEAVLGDGRVLWCSPKSNEDLFYGIPGTFGTIAIITRVKVYCIKAEPYVSIKCIVHSTADRCINYMGYVQDKYLGDPLDEGDHPYKCDFLEGLGFGPRRVVSVAAKFCSKEKKRQLLSKRQRRNRRSDVNIYRECNKFGTKWFYNQIKDFTRISAWGAILQKLPPNEMGIIVMPTKDYLFRHDRGSFWMASYRIPQIIGTFLMGKLLDSTNMFKLATALPWAFPKSQIMLQDYMLPRSQANSFLRGMQDILNIWPIWFLPMRNIKSNNRQAPFAGAMIQGHFTNIGTYGIPKKKFDFIEHNKYLEGSLSDHQGRKVYYSHAFYDRDFFYKGLHDGGKYFNLRSKYGADEAFTDVYDKIITKNGEL